MFDPFTYTIMGIAFTIGGIAGLCLLVKDTKESSKYEDFKRISEKQPKGEYKSPIK